MSHFIGLCFGVCWESNLDYYDESRDVEPYVKYTKQEAIEREKQIQERNYEYAIKAIEEDSIPQERLIQLNQIIAKGVCISDAVAWEEVKQWGYPIDEDENLLSSYNPDSKWDWYSVGGRWDGFLVLKERDEEGGIIETNEALVGEVDWEYMLEHKYPPFCYVDEDGEWFEKGEMGWWGVAFDEKPEDSWKTQFSEYLKEVNSDCLVTVVDFHI